MCGRTACTLAPQKLQQIFKAVSVEGQDKFKPSYNVPPGRYQPVLVETANEDGTVTRKIILMKWGLVTRWNRAQSGVPHPINARCEKLTNTNMYKPLVKNRRCVILADGYFEWKKLPSGKQPYFFRPSPDNKDEKKSDISIKEENPDKNIEDKDKFSVLTMAGIYDVFEDKETGELLYSYAIITVPASKQTASIHDRMPAILDHDEVDMWLNSQLPVPEAVSLLKPKENLVIYPVSGVVGNFKNDVPECIIPIDLTKQSSPKKSACITSFFKSIKSDPIKEESEVKSELQVKEEPKVKEEPVFDDIPDVWDISFDDISTESTHSPRRSRSPSRSPRRKATPVTSDQLLAEVSEDEDDNKQTEGGKKRKREDASGANSPTKRQKQN